ncbi:MAG: DsbC family protein [Rhodanobacter sp.]
MLKKMLLVAGLSAALATACVAAESPPSNAITPDTTKLVLKALQKLAPQAQIDSLEPAPMPGFYQVITSGQLMYLSTDGKYLLNGDLLDLEKMENASEPAWAKFRKAELAKIPVSQRIVYAPEHPKYTVTVFTDVTCGYCQKLHTHMDAFNKAGIAVEYLAWPREGLTTTSGRPTPTYTEMVSVWCAPDRKAAFSAAMGGSAPKSATCSNSIKNEFNAGMKIGIGGTPAVIGPDGRMLGGYLTPAQLLKALETPAP